MFTVQFSRETFVNRSSGFSNLTPSYLPCFPFLPFISCGKMCWHCISWGRCCVVSGAPGEQLIAPVTSTNTGPRQQGPAPSAAASHSSCHCPHTGQGDFVPSWWKNDSYCSYNVRKSQGATGFSVCPFLSVFISPLPSLPLSIFLYIFLSHSLQYVCIFSLYLAGNDLKFS